MICPKCGVKVVSEAAFCPVCGAKLEETPPAQPGMNSAFASAGDLGGGEPAAQPAPKPAADYVPKHASPAPARPSASSQVPMWDSVQHSEPAAAYAPKQKPMAPAGGAACPNCGNPVAEGVAFCGSCGHRFAAPKAPVKRDPRRRYSAPAKNTKLWIPIAAGVALLLVVALIVGILSIAGGPLVKIGAAAQKTVKAGNFTMEYSVEVDGTEVEGILYADIDVKNRTVSMYTTIENRYMDMTVGIYDGYAFTLYEMSGYSYGACQDIEDILDEIFDAYEETGSGDIGELLDKLDELMYEYAGEELSDYLDFDELEKCLVKFGKAANKEKWLKANAGYSKTKEKGETLYTFAPNAYDFLMASLPYFETAFEDSDMYGDMMDSMEDMEDYLDDEASMEYTIGVKSGYLSSITVTLDMDGEEMEIALKIYDVNKTKLEESELQDMLDEAERYS